MPVVLPLWGRRLPTGQRGRTVAGVCGDSAPARTRTRRGRDEREVSGCLAAVPGCRLSTGGPGLGQRRHSGLPGSSRPMPGCLFLPPRAMAEAMLLVMLPVMVSARAAGLHLGGGVRIPGIAAVTQESAAARSAPPEGRAWGGRGPRGSVPGCHGHGGTGRNGPLAGAILPAPAGSSPSSRWKGSEAAVCEGHRALRARAGSGRADAGV